MESQFDDDWFKIDSDGGKIRPVGLLRRAIQSNIDQFECSKEVETGSTDMTVHEGSLDLSEALFDRTPPTPIGQIDRGRRGGTEQHAHRFVSERTKRVAIDGCAQRGTVGVWSIHG